MRVCCSLSPSCVSALRSFPSTTSSQGNRCSPPGVTFVTMETTVELYVKC